MTAKSHLLNDTVQFAADDQILILNSAADPFVHFAREKIRQGMLTLAEDNVAVINEIMHSPDSGMRHVPFHDYLSQQPAGMMDVAVLNLLYQPSNPWMYYALQVAYHALRPAGKLYVLGAKDRGILSFSRHMQEQFGHIETLSISKGQRVLRAIRNVRASNRADYAAPDIFARNKLDTGHKSSYSGTKSQCA